MKATVEGIERGHFLIGPLEPEGRKYLFCVTRVLGTHSVTAVTHMGSLVCEINLKTNGIYKEESEWSKVVYTENTGLARQARPRGGILIDSSYMAAHRSKADA
jgi:hypothetical protein